MKDRKRKWRMEKWIRTGRLWNESDLFLMKEVFLGVNCESLCCEYIRVTAECLECVCYFTSGIKPLASMSFLKSTISRVVLMTEKTSWLHISLTSNYYNFIWRCSMNLQDYIVCVWCHVHLRTVQNDISERSALQWESGESWGVILPDPQPEIFSAL